MDVSLTHSYDGEQFEKRTRAYRWADGYFINGQEVTGGEYSDRLEASYLRQDLDNGPYRVVRTQIETVYPPEIRLFQVVKKAERRVGYDELRNLAFDTPGYDCAIYDGHWKRITNPIGYIFPEDLSDTLNLVKDAV